MKTDDKELRELWEKYIDSKFVYRVISDEYTKDTKKNGLNPKKDPFKRIKPKLERLFQLVLKLEKQGKIIYLDWKKKEPVKGSYAVIVTKTDLNSPFIDFTPHLRMVLQFKKQWKGGAVVTNTNYLCKEILKLNVCLTEKEKSLIKELFEWTKKKSKYKNRVIFIKGSSKYLENAYFQHFLGKKEKKKYWVSPYGSFKHFKQFVKSYGIKRYLPFFKEEKFACLRVTKRIPVSEIIKIV